MPEIHAEGRCRVLPGSAAATAVEWHAWITDYAVPLDQYVKQRGVPQRKCIAAAVRCIVVAACSGLVLSDNGLYNFGVLGRKVVIIDAGSLAFASQSAFQERSKLPDKDNSGTW